MIDLSTLRADGVSGDRLVRLVLGVLVVVGAVVRFLVARQDLFADELATYWIVSTRSLPEVVETVSTTAEITPPLSFMLSWLTTRLGLAEELVRLPALIAGVATIPLVYAVGVRTVGRGAALAAAALVTFSPFMIFYSAEARSYGVLMALTLLSTWALLRAVDDGGRGWWVLYGVAVCAVMYTHYTAIFVLGVQFVWAWWVSAASRRALVTSTAAAGVLYVPWLPSLRGDLDSPTTIILDFLSPFDLDAVRITLGHWTLGYPFGSPRTSLGDMPGLWPSLVMVAGVVLGFVGLWSARSRLGPWFAKKQWRVVLVVVLALATPVGAAVQSAIGNNVFSTRSMAPSTPYLALTVAALVTVGRPRVRVAAAALLILGFALSASQLVTSDDFVRPRFGELTEFAANYPDSVIIEGFTVTPGPFTNLDVEGSIPAGDAFRLTLPEQKITPFSPRDRRPDPADVAVRAAAAAAGGPIIIFSGLPPTEAARALLSAPVVAFIDSLPAGYVETDMFVAAGMFDVEARVFELQLQD